MAGHRFLGAYSYLFRQGMGKGVTKCAHIEKKMFILSPRNINGISNNWNNSNRNEKENNSMLFLYLPSLCPMIKLCLYMCVELRPLFYYCVRERSEWARRMFLKFIVISQKEIVLFRITAFPDCCGHWALVGSGPWAAIILRIRDLVRASAASELKDFGCNHIAQMLFLWIFNWKIKNIMIFFFFIFLDILGGPDWIPRRAGCGPRAAI